MFCWVVNVAQREHFCTWPIQALTHLHLLHLLAELAGGPLGALDEELEARGNGLGPAHQLLRRRVVSPEAQPVDRHLEARHGAKKR